MKFLQIVRNKGKEAFNQGKKHQDNPYQQDTQEYWAWLEGFREEWEPMEDERIMDDNKHMGFDNF